MGAQGRALQARPQPPGARGASAGGRAGGLASDESERPGSRPPGASASVREHHARAQDGAPLAPGAIGKIVARYATAADLPPALRTPHVLRHTFCTAIAERKGLEVVAELAGHADVRTSKRYVTVTAERTLSAIDHAFGAGTFAGGWGER
jgi:integrase/recombinase XerD